MSMKRLQPVAIGSARPAAVRRAWCVVVLGLAALAGTGFGGIGPAHANDPDGIYSTMRDDPVFRRGNTAPRNPVNPPAATAPAPAPRGGGLLPRIFGSTPSAAPAPVVTTPPQSFPAATTPPNFFPWLSPTLRTTPEVGSTPESRAASRGPGFRRPSAGSGSLLGGDMAFCVRTCDGFYFPLPATTVRGEGGSTSGRGIQTRFGLCSSLCPGATVDVYSTASGATTMGSSINQQSRTYASLRTAFRHQSQGTPEDCSCRAAGDPGLMRLDLNEDPTLREGDIVVTASGVRVFRGASAFPFRDRDFVDFRRVQGLPRDLVTRLTAIDQPYRDATKPAIARGSAGDAPLTLTVRARATADTPASVPAAAPPEPAAEPADPMTPVRLTPTPEAPAAEPRAVRVVGPALSFGAQ